MTEQEKREKVISDLAILRTWVAVNPDYGVGLSVTDCRKAVKWLDDALELLKAQEPVKPTYRRGIAFCGKCGLRLHKVVEQNNYCQNCGRPVKWD